jgi:GNAT superfamily N-acetyltransferase
MEIGYLADHLEFLPALALRHHKEWGYLRPGDSADARAERLRKICGRGEIPSVFVAFSGGTLFGSAMLVAHDMETRMELTPWLAGVFVAPERRRQGVGSALVQRVIDCAATLRVSRLYLYTPSAERMYSKLGWSTVERTEYRRANVLIMQREIEH